MASNTERERWGCWDLVGQAMCCVKLSKLIKLNYYNLLYTHSLCCKVNNQRSLKGNNLILNALFPFCQLLGKFAVCNCLWHSGLWQETTQRHYILIDGKEVHICQHYDLFCLSIVNKAWQAIPLFLSETKHIGLDSVPLPFHFYIWNSQFEQ